MGTRLITAMLLIASWASPVVAQEKQLAGRFQIPEQGHMKILHCLSQEFKTRPIQSSADLLVLHQQIADIPFDEEAITSWQVLEKAGLKRVERYVPLAIGNATPIVQWRVTTVDFDKDRFAQQDTIGQLESVYVETPVSKVSLTRHPMHVQVNHANPGQKIARRRLDVDRVFSRSATLLDQPFQTHSRHRKEFVEFSLERVLWNYVTQPDRDLIEARLSEAKNGRGIFNFTLHWYSQPPTSEDGIWIPKLTGTFSRTKSPRYPGDLATYRVELYIIQEADFVTPVKPEAFQVPVQRGDTYVHIEAGTHYTRHVPLDMKDIANLSPLTVQERIDIEHKNLSNGRY